MPGALRAFFADPARQALAWAGLGILGIALAAVGLWLYQNGHNGGQAVRAQAVSPTATVSLTPAATATATASSIPSPTPSATPSASPSPTTTPTTGPQTQRESNGAGTEPTPTPVPPTPTPTQPPVVAAGPYCDTTSAGSPATVMRIAGNFTVGGAAGPAGKTVTLLFDGLPGPSGTTVAGGYGITYAIGSSSCANRPGAAISLAYEGAVFATGATVPNGNAGSLQVAPLSVN